MSEKAGTFEKIYEKLTNGDGEKANLIGVSTPAHPGKPFLYFLVIPGNNVTGTSEDWAAVEEDYKRQSMPRSSVDMVYYLGVPKEVATALLQRNFTPDKIRKEIVQYMWGKIGRLKTDYLTGKFTFIPGSASEGPIRRGERYLI